MIELYGAGGSRWAKCYWVLKELGLEFKEHVLNLRDGEQKSPQMLAMNPFGKAPVLKDGEVTLFESMAVTNYLCDKYSSGKLIPKSGTLERALYDQWHSFCITELEQPLWRIVKHTFLFPESMRIPQDVELAKKEFTSLATVLNQQVGSKKFMVGSDFTAADITMTYTLNWANRFELVRRHANLMRYLEFHKERPSFPANLYVQ